MTSIPSPFDALRALLPGFGRDGGPGALLPGLDAEIGDMPEMEEGRPRESHGRGLGADGPDGRAHSHLRGDGAGPLTHVDPVPLAVLANALRQNPSHPLFREVSQLPPETLRQLLQVLSQPGSSAGERPGQAEPLARPNAHIAPETRNAAQHPVSSDARAVAQAPQDRAVAPGREALAAAFAGRIGENIRGPAPSPDGRAAAGSALHAVLPTLPTLAALPARSDGLPGLVNTPPATPHAAVPQDGRAAAIQDGPMPQQLQVPRAGDGAHAARADGALAGGDTASSAGLPGAVAAGVTLAAVGNPAGTTFAVAPHATLRPRQAGDARNDTRKRVADDTMREEEGHEDRDGGKGRDDGGDRRQASGDGHGAERPASPRAEGRPHSDTAVPRVRAASPATGTTGDAGRSATSDARQTTTDKAPARTAAAVHAIVTGLTLSDLHDADAGGDAGHRADDDGAIENDEGADERRARQCRWLYWTLIAVAYSCLGLAAATVAVELLDLPVAQQSRGTWRHGLTLVGLASALWAWLLARRMR